MRMRENGTICPFVLFSQFSGIFRVKIGPFPLNVVVLECGKGIMGVEKDTVSLGSKHKQPKCPQNKGKPTKTIIGLIAGIGLKLHKKLLRHKEKEPKGQMVP